MRIGAAQPRSRLIDYRLTNSAEVLAQVDVELKAGTYRYEWFDAAKSAIAGAGRIESSGKEQQFKAPFDGDAALYLKAE